MSAWPKRALGEVAAVNYGTRVTRKQDAGSRYPVYGGGGATFAMDISNRDSCYIVARFGMSEQCVRYVNGHFFLNDSGLTVDVLDAQIIEQRFLDTWLLASQAEIYALGRGTAQKNLNVESFKRLLVPLPPLEEQKRIVAVLDQAFGALDRARALAEANLADAEEFFDSWASVAFRLEGVDRPTVYLPDISENLDRSRVPITKADRKPGNVPYYGASGEVDRVADFIFDEDLLLVSEDGANLLARTYAIAFSISGKSWVNNHAHVLRFANPTDQEYVRLYLNSIPLDDFVSGMAQPKLNQKALNKIPIPFPDAANRQGIVEEAERLTALTTRAVAQCEKALKDINELRLSILSTAFAGRL